MSSTLLEINDLIVKYILENSEVIANKNISLSIQEGDKSCLLGFNGSGKTTLLKACIGLLSQDAKIESGKMIPDIRLTKKLENALKLDVDIIHGPIRQDDMIEINKEVEIYAA